MRAENYPAIVEASSGFGWGSTMSVNKNRLLSGAAACVILALAPGMALADEASAGPVEAAAAATSEARAGGSDPRRAARPDAAVADTDEEDALRFTFWREGLMTQRAMMAPLSFSAPQSASVIDCFEVTGSIAPNAIQCGSWAFTVGNNGAAFGTGARALDQASAFGGGAIAAGFFHRDRPWRDCRKFFHRDRPWRACRVAVRLR